VQEAEGPEAAIAEADKLLKADDVAGAGRVYKATYEEISKDPKPAVFLQARCLAGLGKTLIHWRGYPTTRY
jgi:hypothetical protein